jgi:hypothetical protein
MNVLREILALAVFLFGCYLIVILFKGGFDWLNLVAAIGCFVGAYVVWPSKKRGQREEDSVVLDILEIFIELPVEMVLWIFRFFWRTLRNSDGGINIDF